MELNFVIPGWYKNKYSNSDTIQTIRVIKGGDKSPNHFLLSDGREMHENEILDSWEYMPTSINEDGFQENFKIGDIENNNQVNETKEFEIPIGNEEINNKIYNLPFILTKNKTEIIDSEVPNIEVHSKFVTNNPEEIFVNQLLKKLSSEQQLENKGEIQFKSTFDIPIKFTFNYDLNKLRKILKLIDINTIDLDLFVNKIISNDLNDINNKINEAIKSFILSEEIENNISSDKINNVVKNKLPIIKNDKKILSNTNNYLNQF